MKRQSRATYRSPAPWTDAQIDKELSDITGHLNSWERVSMANKLERWAIELRHTVNEPQPTAQGEWCKSN